MTTATPRNPETSDRTRIRNEILATAQDAFSKLMVQLEPTPFDHALFGFQFSDLQSGRDIQFHSAEWRNLDPHIQKIITSRLKLLGYRFDPPNERWNRKYPPR